MLRNGARTLRAQAVEAEVAEFLVKHADRKAAGGLRPVVRHGHLPEREVMTGISPVGVRQPQVRDRGATDAAGRIRFTPVILPPYARRSRSLEVLIPILYLKGLSTGDLEEALDALLGKDALGHHQDSAIASATAPKYLILHIPESTLNSRFPDDRQTSRKLYLLATVWRWVV